jgi:hypothetical protein
MVAIFNADASCVSSYGYACQHISFVLIRGRPLRWGALVKLYDRPNTA